MFYDLIDPKLFVRDIENILDDDGIWCVQISYLPSMLENNNFYDICHEHLSYYSLDSFEYLLKQLNLKCFNAETNAVNGGSIRLFVCKKACNKYNKPEYFNNLDRIRKDEKDYNLKDKSTFINFEQKITEIKNVTNAFVDKIIQSKETALGLGVSTKGNILLQYFGLDKSKIPFISERNLYK